MLRFLPVFCSGCWNRIHTQETRPSREASGPDLCQDCARELWLLRLASDSTPSDVGETICLYRYEGLMRDLVWRAKIKDDHRALDLLLHCGLLPKALAWGHWADLIIAAPSSLWGRLRGRLDVAYHLAHSVGRHVQKPVFPAPWHLYWRLSKNAQKRLSERHSGEQGSSPSTWERRHLGAWSRRLPVSPDPGGASCVRILVVDDVLTTGSTLRRVGSALSKAFCLRGFRPELRALALAKSGA